MTPTFEKVREDINHNYETKRKRALQDLEHTEQSSHEDLLAVTHVTSEFITTGIADITNVKRYPSIHLHGVGWGYRGFRWPRYVRELAHDLKRPFVLVNKSYKAHYLQISKRAYTHKLYAHLFLLPPEVVTYRSNTRDLFFSFIGEEGENIYNAWREQCRTDKRFKQALRLI